MPVQQQLAVYDYNTAFDLIGATNIAEQTEYYQYQQHLIIQRQRASGFKHYFTWQGQGPTAKCIRNWGDDGYYDYHFTYNESLNKATNQLINLLSTIVGKKAVKNRLRVTNMMPWAVAAAKSPPTTSMHPTILIGLICKENTWNNFQQQFSLNSTTRCRQRG